jgi:hypothetical protein
VTVPPLWVTVKVCPAIVTLPVRAATDTAGAAVTTTLPAPVPPGADSDNHATAVVAVHAGVSVKVVDTVTGLPSPAAANVEGGATVNVGTPAACVTVSTCPPIVTVACRGPALVVVFADAVSVTLPVPVRGPPFVTVSQL